MPGGRERNWGQGGVVGKGRCTCCRLRALLSCRAAPAADGLGPSAQDPQPRAPNPARNQAALGDGGRSLQPWPRKSLCRLQQEGADASGRRGPPPVTRRTRVRLTYRPLQCCKVGISVDAPYGSPRATPLGMSPPDRRAPLGATPSDAVGAPHLRLTPAPVPHRAACAAAAPAQLTERVTTRRPPGSRRTCG